MSSDEEGEASAATESEEEAPKKTPSESRGELNPLSKRKKLVLLHAILLKEIDGAEMITMRMKFTWFDFH